MGGHHGGIPVPIDSMDRIPGIHGRWTMSRNHAPYPSITKDGDVVPSLT